ncbi:protein ACCELERATED CELL DEATH 6-like [Typha angustifolia]|uniref:protein ACCELERATED CELL DEATH 6-like n=1 Tax=Typha angustifolia TaxID=59011 RepID=UPI003C2B8D56
MTEGPQRILMDPNLLKAARTGDQSLLEQDPGVSILYGVTPGGNTALHIAASHGHLELAKMICERKGSLLVARNVMLETPLHCAARAGHDKIVSSIVSFSRNNGVGVETVLRARSRDGRTALHEAAQNGHVRVANELISADPGLANMVDDEGISPSYLAAMAESIPFLRILQSPPFPISYAGPNGQTALHAAVFQQNLEIAEKLLRWEPKLAKHADISGSTPLHYAASAGNGRMVKLLLKHDTSLAYIADSGGLFPVHVAAITGEVSIVDELIKHCPYSDELVDNEERNLLHIVVKHKNKPIVWYVCKRPELVKLMNGRDYQGNTPLHLAVKIGDQGIVSLLMQNKTVNSSIINKEGLTPLDISTGALASPRRVDHFRRDYKQTDLDEEAKKHLYINRSSAISSVLIATVTFAVAFTLPGGYKADGTPTLAGRYTFKAFIIADALAFIFSMLSTFWITFGGSVLVQPRLRSYYVVCSNTLLVLETRCMIAAFALCIYLVLAPVSNSIGIVVCVTTSASILLDTPDKIQICRLAITIKSRELVELESKSQHRKFYVGEDAT